MLSSTLIDEVGYLSFDDKAADLLYEVVNRRYERKPLILTTNRPFKEWNEVFPMRLASLRSSIDCSTTPRSPSSRATAIASARASRKPRRAGGRSESPRGMRPMWSPLLMLYTDLPDTPLRPSPERINRLPVAFSNKRFRCRWSSPLCCSPRLDGWPVPIFLRFSKIRSLAYFLPVITELQQQPLPDGYLDYLRLKLQKQSQANRPGVQKSTFSGDR